MHQPGEEHRNLPRVPHADDIIVKVLSAPDNKPPEGTTCYAEIRDLSGEGIGLARLRFLLPAPTRLEIWIKCKRRQRLVRLFGEVRWCRTDTDAGFYEAGVALDGNSQSLMSRGIV